MALFTTALGLYGGVLWSGELQGFIAHEMMPSPGACACAGSRLLLANTKHTALPSTGDRPVSTASGPVAVARWPCFMINEGRRRPYAIGHRQ
jgi:hypothetical protein